MWPQNSNHTIIHSTRSKVQQHPYTHRTSPCHLPRGQRFTTRFGQLSAALPGDIFSRPAGGHWAAASRRAIISDIVASPVRAECSFE